MATISDVKDSNGVWLATAYIDKVQCISKSYSIWHGLKQRCKSGGYEQKHRPTYEGCYVSDNFKDFQFFAEWYTKQVGYNTAGYQVDKDLLSEGNKCYGEDYCVLLPQQLNKFLLTSKASRGEFPLGVTLFKNSGMFMAQISIDGVVRCIGLYATPEAAHQAYKKAKEAEAYRWYERLLAGEFVVDARVIERMRTWTLPDNS